MSKFINQGGITKQSYTSEKQILINSAPHFSVGVVVGNAGVTADSNGRKIIKAGTPLIGNLDTRTTAFVVATTDTAPTAVGVALHDVDVTSGNSNATLLLTGAINKNMIETSVNEIIAAATALKVIALKF